MESTGVVDRDRPGRTGSAAAGTVGRRLESIDLLRGLVMVLMALDHTRDFVHGDSLRFDPLDLSQTTPMLFLTRWITHFCAPVFVFIAGTSVYLQRMRGASTAQLSRFLLTRGAWLVLLEFTVIRVVVFFNVDFGSFLALMQVIWVLGASMIALAGLIYLPVIAIAGIGFGMIALHNLLDGIQLPAWQPGEPAPDLVTKAWFFLHQPNQLFPLFAAPAPTVFVVYPLIPWVGVMAAGYAFGTLYALESARRRQLLFRFGMAGVAAFIAVRASNFYGDPVPWQEQSSAMFTALSFLNTAKYPPSLLFLLMTLGPAMLMLAWLDGRSIANPVGRGLVMFGRVPLFFYILQWPLAHTLALVFSIAAGKDIGYLFLPLPDFFAAAPADAGFSLAVTYLAWAMVVAVLFFLCRWYAGVKARSRSALLKYL